MHFKNRVEKILIIMIFVVIFTNIKISYAKEGTELNKGNYVKFGHYFGEQILWRVIKDDDVNHRVMLISDRILMLKAFDASGENNGRGNNKWNASNLRDWLNSEKNKLTDEDWTHGKPIYSYEGYNNYEDEAGFLSNFLENERNIIVKRNDDGEENDNGNKVTLLIEEDIQLLTEAGYTHSGAKPTKLAIEKSEYKHTSLNENSHQIYWTRIPYTSELYYVYIVSYTGFAGHSNNAYRGDTGVRPVIWLDTSNIMINDVSGTSKSQAYTIDLQEPKITNSIVEENVLKNSIYGEEQIRNGVTVIDDIDEDITSNIQVSGDTIDTSKLGDYIIRYNVEDNAGNKANEVTRVVHVVKGYEGYEIGTSSDDRKYFKYYIGLDKRGVIRCMMVCADGGNNILKRVFDSQDVLDLGTYKFKDCYYIDEHGKIKKYTM